MKLPIYQVDSFAHRVFSGNPAAVVISRDALSDSMCLHIAAENNVSETSFIWPAEDGYHLRWFTPTTEVDLCGHGTLAAAHVLFSENSIDADFVLFSTASGELTVERIGDEYQMNFPTYQPQPTDIADNIRERLGFEPKDLLRSSDFIVVVTTEQNVREFSDSFYDISGDNGVILTAESTDTDGLDIISRYFGFKEIGIEEDPVTGSAHCAIVQYWCNKLDKEILNAFQASPRGGYLTCERVGDRVLLKGKAITYLKGECYIESEGDSGD